MAGQSVLHTTVMFYSDCVKMFEDFVPNFGNKRTAVPFDTIEVIEGELCRVLNTLTQHDSYDVLNKWQKSREQCMHVEGEYFKGDGGQ
jgi:hypothetical protein